MANYFAGDSNVIQLLRFEDGDWDNPSPSKLWDYSGNANHATLQGLSRPTRNTSIYREGDSSGFMPSSLIPGYLSHDPLSANHPLSTGYLSDRNITVCVWVRFTEWVADRGGIYGLWTNFVSPYADRSFILYIEDQGTNEFYFKFGKGWLNGAVYDGEYTSHSLQLSLDTWYHVALTYADPTGAVKLRVYNQTAGTATEVTDTHSYGLHATGDTNWNFFQWSGAQYYINPNSYFDEGIIFDRILTSDEIDLVRKGQYGLDLTPSDPAIFFSSDDSVTTNLYKSLTEAPQYPMKEKLSWLTNIIRPDYTNGEQRITLRKVPRQTFTYLIDISTQQRTSEVYALLNSNLKKKWGIGVWAERIHHSGSISIGASSISIDTTTSDFRDASYGLVWKNESNWEILNISTVAADSLSLSTNVLNDYIGGCYVTPLRFGYVRGMPKRTATKTRKTYLDVELECIDNELLTGYVATQTYDGLEVMTRASSIDSDNETPDMHDPDMNYLDNETGLLGIQNNTDFNIVTQPHHFHIRTASEIWDFRKWLHSLYGRQNIFLVPSFSQDFTLSRAIDTGDSTIYINNAGFHNYIGDSDLIRYIGFETTDGTVVVRKIDSTAEVDSTEETITLTTTVGTAFLIADKVMLVHRCRLGSDDINMQWYEPNSIKCSVNFVRVTQ